MKIIAFLVIVLGAGQAFAADTASPPTGPSLLTNGNFASGDQWPDDWPRAEGTSWEKEAFTW